MIYGSLVGSGAYESCMVDISVTFPMGPAGALALVRFKAPGRRPEFRTFPLGADVPGSMDELLGFIWSHMDGPAMIQGWLWEA